MPADVVQNESFPTAVQGPAGGDPRTATSVRAMGSPLAKRTYWTWRRVQELIGSYKAATAIDAGADTITIPAHGISDQAPIAFRAIDVGGGASLPTGLTVMRYAKYIDADTIKVSATAGGAALDLVDTGTGDIYVVKIVDAGDYLWCLANGVLPVGTLRTQLAYIKDNFARVAAANLWTVLQTFKAGLTFEGSSTVPSYIEYRVEDLTDASQDVQPTADEFVCATPGAARTMVMKASAPTPREGTRVRFVRGAAGAFDIHIYRDGAAVLGTLPSSTACSVELVYRGGVWRGSLASTGTTAGANW